MHAASVFIAPKPTQQLTGAAVGQAAAGVPILPAQYLAVHSDGLGLWWRNSRLREVSCTQPSTGRGGEPAALEMVGRTPLSRGCASDVEMSVGPRREKEEADDAMALAVTVDCPTS